MRLLLLVLIVAIRMQGQTTVIPVPTDLDCGSEMGTTTEVKPPIGTIVTSVARPELHYLAPVARAARAAAVMIIPGGGYHIEAWDLEGIDIARYLTNAGYHTFVLRHRLPGKLSGDCKRDAALSDATAAMRHIRGLADSLGYSRDKIGVMGFSAGGHLAGSVSVHARVVDSITSRPDFSVLVYPVLSMDSVASGHRGSQNALLGEAPDRQWLEFYDIPARVDSLSPPAILFHASDDGGVHPANSLRYYRALVDHGVAADLRIYAEGGHGFGSARELNGPVSHWLEELVAWMENL